MHLGPVLLNQDLQGQDLHSYMEDRASSGLHAGAPAEKSPSPRTSTTYSYAAAFSAGRAMPPRPTLCTSGLYSPFNTCFLCAPPPKAILSFATFIMCHRACLHPNLQTHRILYLLNPLCFYFLSLLPPHTEG